MKKALAISCFCLLMGCTAITLPSYRCDVKLDADASTARGESTRYSLLFGLFNWGDAGIEAAMYNGNIEKIHHVENKILTAFPFWVWTCLPGLYSEYTTVIYGTVRENHSITNESVLPKEKPVQNTEPAAPPSDSVSSIPVKHSIEMDSCGIFVVEDKSSLPGMLYVTKNGITVSTKNINYTFKSSSNFMINYTSSSRHEVVIENTKIKFKILPNDAQYANMNIFEDFLKRHAPGY
jgi:hypothetical protein